MILADHIPAVVNFLKSDVKIGELTAGKIWGEDLPRSENNNMPQSCIVVRSAGGPSDRSLSLLGVKRVDIRCYGTSPYRARQLAQEVNWALKHRLQRKTVQSGVDTVLLHSAVMESGFIALTEPETTWPLLFMSWHIRIGLLQAV